MNQSGYLITGATGLLGSHIAEQLVERGAKVKALVRGSSQTDFLKSLGVECIVGDIADLANLRKAFEGIEVVIHSAAKVGDWGKPSEFRHDTIEGSRNVAQAVIDAGVKRFIHISSTSAYGHPEEGEGPITEDFPPRRKYWLWDHYTRAKVEAEDILWKLHREEKLPLTIIRPGWMYGPRDRLTAHRIHSSLKMKRVRLIGDGANRLNTVYAGSVAHCTILAAEHAQSLGQAYNCTNDGVITQMEWFDLWAKVFQLPPPTRIVPYRIAFSAASLIEGVARLLRRKKAPFITRYATWLLGRSTIYSTEKAERELGWKPVVSYQEGVELTARWYLTRENG